MQHAARLQGATAVRELVVAGRPQYRNLFRETLRRIGSKRTTAAAASVLAVLFTLSASSQMAPGPATSPVGATSGGFDVTASGAATYTIPIVVPPGTNRVQPSLALVYSSQSGNGSLGAGWSLDGLSAIHRCGATFEIDGFKGGVNYDEGDRFCLDGERLVSIGGREYRTRNETLQKIVASDSSANPTSFIVYSKDGDRREYGLTTDSRIEASPPKNTTVRLWALNRVRDRHGNYFTIRYQESNIDGEFVPSEIQFTGNDVAGTLPDSAVQFDYDLLAVADTAFQSGTVIRSTRRLTQIRTCSDVTCSPGSLVRKYLIGYDSNGTLGRSRATDIQECGTDGTCLPATQVGWSPAGTNSFADIAQWHTDFGLNHGWADNSRYPRQLADVNGDGLVDVVGFASDGVYVALSTGSSFATMTRWHTDFCLNHGWADTSRYPRQLVDVNSDGLADVVGFASDGVYVALSTGSSFATMTQWHTDFGLNHGWADTNRYPRQLVDVNSDGLADVVGFASDGVYVALSTGNSFAAMTRWNLDFGINRGWQDFSRYPRQLVDVNGDGLADVVGFANNGVYVALSTGSSFTTVTQWNTAFGINSGWQDVNRYPRELADVNGDGLPDIVGFANSGVYVALSTGNSFTTITRWHTEFGVNQGWQDDSRYPRQLADVNGDGLGDVVGFANNGVYVALSTGSSFTTITQWNTEFGVNRSWHDNNRYPRQLADVDGDGLVDVVGFGDSVYSSINLAQFSDRLTEIRDGLGASTAITYASLASATGPPSVYTKDIGQCASASSGGGAAGGTNCYPYVNIQVAAQVVSDVRQSNGIGGQNATTYRYGGLKAHTLAGASLGFRWIKKTDPAGLVTVTYNNQNREAGIDGTPARTDVFGPNGALLTSVKNTWQRIRIQCGSATPTYGPELVAAVEESRELGSGELITRVDTSKTYDACGFLERSVISADDGWRKTVTNEYRHDAASWILGRITRTDVMADAPGQPSQTRASSFSYRTDGMLESETIEPGNAALSLTTAYGYDPFGNRISTTVSGADFPSRTASQVFDAQGRFAIRKINELGHASTHEYDPRTGQPKKTIDPNGLVASWAYDGLGRKTLEARPDGTWTTISYDVRANGYGIGTVTTGAANTYTDFDLLGRESRRATYGFGGRWTFVTTKYDALGRVAQVSNPHFNGDPVYSTTRSYDALGRVIASTAPGDGNRTTTTAYDGLTTTVTNTLGQQTVTVKNSQGKPVSVTDAAGYVTRYVYDAFGNLVQVTDPAGHDTLMMYDLRGHKIGMFDPDMLSWGYRYNALGELIEQTDAKGQRINLTYDKLGRKVSRTTPEGTSFWVYDTGYKGIGKLAAIGAPNGSRETYAYDSAGRPSATTTTIAGLAYTTTQTYDAYGRLDTLTYPKGYTIRNTYDDFGYLWRIGRVSGSNEYLVWMADTADAFNHVTSEYFGNTNGTPTTSRRVYDQATSDLLSIQTGPGTSAAVQPTIQDLSYSYDTRHNLTGRDDTITALNETFSYDILNRLTRATGAVTKTYGYDAIGNFTYKSDVGTYAYNHTGGIRPHAVSSVSGLVNATYSYDHNGNMVGGAGRTLTYTSFNKPASITTVTAAISYVYDANDNRIQQIAGNKTTTTIGKLFEREVSNGVAQDKSYVYAGNTLVAIHTGRSSGGGDTKYVHTDHLGSINVITDDDGAVVERLSFDPHGKRRQANGHDATASTNSQINRGFTGHEMDDEVGLINMNARLYDPALGRFITPDTIVEGIAGQGLNRYSYVLNNPLSLIDPTGHFSLKKALKGLFRAAVAIASIYFAGPIGTFGSSLAVFGSQAIGQGIVNGAILGFVTGGTLKSTFYGALNGAVFGGIGDLRAGVGDLYGKSAANAFGIGSHAVAGGALNSIAGGDFRSGFLGSGFGAALSPIIAGLPGGVEVRTIAAGVSGGIAAKIAGGNFLDGALPAAYGYLFNDLLHENTPAASGLHRRLVVRDANGNVEYGISFGMNDNGNPFTDNFSRSGANPGPGGAGNGEVYVDTQDPSTKTVRVFRTSAAEDRMIVDYMKSRIGDVAPYNVITNSCRTFTADQFDYIKEQIGLYRTYGKEPFR